MTFEPTDDSAAPLLEVAGRALVGISLGPYQLVELVGAGLPEPRIGDLPCGMVPLYDRPSSRTSRDARPNRGTGIVSWKQFVRAVQADVRRAERSAARRHRELQGQQRAMAREQAQAQRQAARENKEQQKRAEQQRAENEAAQYESYVELLVSLHKESSDAWDWPSLAAARAPSPPVKDMSGEGGARAAAEFYKPTFFERLFGTYKKVLAAHERAIAEARAADEVAHDKAARAHAEACVAHETRRALAAGVLARDTAAYRRALEHAGPFEEIVAMGTRVSVLGAEPNVVLLDCDITDDELVPTEEVKLTASGKLSTKELPAGRYWLLYQDFVCSAALRLALETLALLPVDRVIVTIGRHQLDTSTGHRGRVVFLTAHFAREPLSRLQLQSIDPSDSMKNFPHRMKFKKAVGFESVDPITTDEQWVTT